MEQVQHGAGAFPGINLITPSWRAKTMTQAHRELLKAEAAGHHRCSARAPPPLHRDARLHLTHSVQSHSAWGARQPLPPACWRSVQPLPREVRDPHIDSLGAGANPLSSGTQMPGSTTESRMVEVSVSTARARLGPSEPLSPTLEGAILAI